MSLRPVRFAVDRDGRPVWIADAHRDNGKRFIVGADEKLTALPELEWAIRGVRESRTDGFRSR